MTKGFCVNWFVFTSKLKRELIKYILHIAADVRDSYWQVFYLILLLIQQNFSFFVESRDVFSIFIMIQLTWSIFILSGSIFFLDMVNWSQNTLHFRHYSFCVSKVRLLISMHIWWFANRCFIGIAKSNVLIRAPSPKSNSNPNPRNSVSSRAIRASGSNSSAEKFRIYSVVRILFGSLNISIIILD